MNGDDDILIELLNADAIQWRFFLSNENWNYLKIK